MAAPNYATNLVDITTAEGTTGFTAIGGGGALQYQETDFFIQGNFCLSKATSNTWDSNGTPRGGAMFNNGAGVTIPADGAVLTWMYWWGPGVLATKDNGGAEVIIGSATTAYRSWYVTGSDDWAFGGWRCYPVDPSLTPDRTVGSPTATRQYFGWQANVAATVNIGRGNPYGIDAIRYGRCDIVATQGDLANGYATFLGAANWDNDPTRRLGLFTPRDGAYYQQGLFQIGTAGTAADFRDSNRVIFIQNTEKVSAAFNRWEIRNASTRVDWTGVNISALGTVSKGQFEMVDNADVNFDSCVFTDMDTFVFQSNGSVVDSTFRRCGRVTLGGATMSGCLITRSTATTALLVGSSVSSLSNTSFVSAGTGHAIEITATGTYTLNGITFTGYAASNGSTGNEAVFVNVASGSVTINSDSALSYRLPVGSTATVTVIAGQKTLSVINVVSGSDVVILAAGTSTVLASNDGATNPVTSFDYSYTYAANTFVDITVYLAGYVPYIVRNFLLPANGGSVQVAQVLDRNYTP